MPSIGDREGEISSDTDDRRENSVVRSDRNHRGREEKKTAPSPADLQKNGHCEEDLLKSREDALFNKIKNSQTVQAEDLDNHAKPAPPALEVVLDHLLVGCAAGALPLLD